MTLQYGAESWHALRSPVRNFKAAQAAYAHALACCCGLNQGLHGQWARNCIWYCKPGAAPKHALPPAAPHHGKGACSPHGAPPQRRRWHKEWAACRTFSLLRRRRLLARERGASFSLAVGKASSAKKVVGGGEDSQGRMFEDGGGICGRLTAPPRSCSRSATPPATSAAPSTTRTCRRCSLNILPAESCPPPVTLFAEDAFSTAKENKPHRSRAKKRRRLSTKDVRRAVCCLRRAFR